MREPIQHRQFFLFDMDIDKRARFIVQRLNEAGYIAYFAGGWVRDFLLGLPSDDIDIATNALPETIQTLFDKTIPIGIAFGIVLVVIEKKHFEVATFRSDLAYKDGRRPSKITFTNAMEDAKRRDFTINGMFYDPIKNQILDFVEGKKDLERKVIRAIGNPHLRFQEDRLRMIRAIRMAARFQFIIEKKTKEAIFAHAKELLPAVSIERIWQEMCKITAYPYAKEAFLLLHECGLLPVIFPRLQNVTFETLQRRIRSIEDFPPKTPTIAYIITLFPPLSLEEKIELAQYLKLSNEDMKFVSFWHRADLLLSTFDKVSKKEWAYFFADPFSTTILYIHAAHLPIDQRHHFLQEYETLKKNLSKAIYRIQEKKPLVTAQDLMQKGIQPGKEMGKLLEEAEAIAIEKGLDDPDKVLEILWKK